MSERDEGRIAETAVRASLRRFVAEASGRLRPGDVADDTPILERRLVTSLQLLDLILRIEELSGRAVDAGRLKPGVFRDVNAIVAHFFERRPA
ncbi:MAG TPA: hypothetical protein VF310_03460 [Vicinamibacteria bacterium]